MDGGLIQNQFRVRDQNVVRPARPVMMKANLATRPAPPGKEGAGRTAVQVHAKRKIPPSDFPHSLQTRFDFLPPMTFSGSKDFLHVRIVFEQLAKARFDDCRNSEIGPPFLQEPERRSEEHDVANGALAKHQDSSSSR